jgi:hypothetical protein
MFHLILFYVTSPVLKLKKNSNNIKRSSKTGLSESLDFGRKSPQLACIPGRLTSLTDDLPASAWNGWMRRRPTCPPVCPCRPASTQTQTQTQVHHT